MMLGEALHEELALFLSRVMSSFVTSLCHLDSSLLLQLETPRNDAPELGT